MEISFVNECDFQKQENRYFWSKTSEWELDCTISLDSNDWLAGISDFGEELESAVDISSHDDRCSDSDTDSDYNIYKHNVERKKSKPLTKKELDDLRTKLEVKRPICWNFVSMEGLGRILHLRMMSPYTECLEQLFAK